MVDYTPDRTSFLLSVFCGCRVYWCYVVGVAIGYHIVDRL